MKKVLIIGASSFIGSNLAAGLRDHFRVFGTFHKRRPKITGVPCFQHSIPYDQPLDTLLDLVHPDAVIYCPGMAGFRDCQNDPLGALHLHAEYPSALAAKMEERKGQFFYLSTSKVFDGESGAYREGDPVNPRTVYGKTKARGEELVQRYAGVFVLRLGTVFGMGSLGQNSILNRTWKELQSGKEQKYISDELRSFYTVEYVVAAVRHLLQLGPDYSGLFHLSHSKRESYYGFAKAVAQTFHLPQSSMVPVTGEKFSAATGSDEARGRDLSLVGAAFERRFGIDCPTLEQSLDSIRANLRLGVQ
jgi:dTDP-4-dehydrorhamnose reductase